jgi:hypothetical protein
MYELAYHDNNDPDGDTDDDIDVSIDLFGEDGPAALEVVVLVVGFRVRLTTLLQQKIFKNILSTPGDTPAETKNIYKKFLRNLFLRTCKKFKYLIPLTK